ncbi:MAG: rhodanese-like domain-containing protein [Bacteroidetes bacterium]|nr:rhodanese-like domain-containing protein [Bacteroidota bacterium]
MSWLSNIFGGGGVKQAVSQGAVIIDLRTAYEYDQGHIPHSLNIPVDRIKANIERIKSFRKPIILCCSTGNHCWEAAEVLRNAGVEQVINGGSWQSLWRKVG